ncbi:hypothetical protein KAX75_13500, partial [candidate division WOR-3 bacterium]|nr:hypothetical protein [candidate division WOR-3 bacterium]
MLFASEDTDAFNQTRALSIKSPRNLLVDRKPIQFIPDRSGALLFDQASTIQGSALACQADTGGAFFCRCGDNFDIPYDANIDSLVWWGYYWQTMTNVITAWNIEFYEDSGGGLGPKQDPVYFAPITVWNEIDLGGWYRYEAVIPPFPANTGVTYYLVAQPVLIFPPQWGVNGDVPPNVGDGIEMYFKSAYFGFPQWVTATTVFGTPYEYGFQIYGPAAGPSSYLWDFETGWQSWTHTNGLAFPQGWDVQISGLHSSYTPPAAGDSSMWIDSDDAGSGTHVADTALSPVVVPPVGMTWLKYGYYNYGGGGSYLNELRSGIKYFTGGVWNVVELA